MVAIGVAGRGSVSVEGVASLSEGIPAMGASAFWLRGSTTHWGKK